MGGVNSSQCCYFLCVLVPIHPHFLSLREDPRPYGAVAGDKTGRHMEKEHVVAGKEEMDG